MIRCQPRSRANLVMVQEDCGSESRRLGYKGPPKKPMVKMIEKHRGCGWVEEGDADFKDPTKAMHLKWDHQWLNVDPSLSS